MDGVKHPAFYGGGLKPHLEIKSIEGVITATALIVKIRKWDENYDACGILKFQPDLILLGSIVSIPLTGIWNYINNKFSWL